MWHGRPARVFATRGFAMKSSKRYFDLMTRDDGEWMQGSSQQAAGPPEPDRPLVPNPSGQTFERRALARLNADEAEHFLPGGVVKPSYPDWDKGPFAAKDREAVDDLLAFDGSKIEHWFEFDPVPDVQAFVANAWPCERGPEPGTVVRTGRHSLKEIARWRLDRHGPPGASLSISDIARGVGARPLVARHKFLRADFAAAVAAVPVFVGMASVCADCVAGCGAEYVWIEGDVCLVHLQISGTRPHAVHILPFRITRD